MKRTRRELLNDLGDGLVLYSPILIMTIVIWAGFAVWGIWTGQYANLARVSIGLALLTVLGYLICYASVGRPSRESGYDWRGRPWQ